MFHAHADVWKEASRNVTAVAAATTPHPAVVTAVEPGSIGEQLGFQHGDRLVRINGVRPRDLIDYRILVSEETLSLEVLDRDGTTHNITLEKEIDDGLGLGFSEALFDGLRQCSNHCPFCFIDQQPPGHRHSLYLKDDDYRLSFLYGSYLTLTNLTAADWQRIETQRLSPLYVSVHATEPALRRRLLKNERAGRLLEQLRWFAERHLQIHAQVVVCPGLNDAEQLERTLRDLSGFAGGDWPAVLSVAVVPVGLTRFRPADDSLIPLNRATAVAVIDRVEAMQRQYLARFGSRFVWLSDEWFLIAERPLPHRDQYEDLPQQENGVGSIRAFLEALDRATADLPVGLAPPRRRSWVVGRLVGPSLRLVRDRLNGVRGLELLLHELPSPYWGQELVVTGLLSGSDLIDGLQGKDLGDLLLLPAVCLRQDSQLFLDDRTLAQVSAALEVEIQVVGDAWDFVRACVG